MNRNDNPVGGAGCAVIAAVVVGIIGLVFFFASTAQVGSNEIGIVSNAGAVDVNQVPLSPGWHFKAPFVQGVDTVSTNQQSHAFAEVQAATQGSQNVYVDGTISFHVDPKYAAHFVIQTAGSGDPGILIQRILSPAFQDIIKETIPHYATYQDVLNGRSDIRDTVRRQLQGKTDQFGLYVDDIYLTNVHPDKSYQDAIAAAAASQQNLVTAQNEAKIRVTQAQADSDANRIRQASITSQTLDQQALNNQAAMIQKWDGKLPQYMGTGNNPLTVFGGTPTK